MALEQKELVQTSGSDIFPVFEKVSMNDHITAIFAASAGAETLSRTAPVGYNDATGYYGAWVAPDPTTILLDGGFTGGTFGLTVDGIVIANTVLAWDATAALVAATILSATGVVATVVLAAGEYTITFDADTQVANLPTVDADITQLTGGTAAKTVTAGTSTFGLHTIRGFVWPDEVVLSATLQVHGEVMVEGRIPYASIAATVDAGDVTALAAALKSTMLGRSIIVEDLPNIH